MNDLLNHLHSLKHAPYGKTVLRAAAGGTPFELQLLTHESARDENVISLLSAWRAMHTHWFPEQFPVSSQRTRTWFTTSVIDTPDRCLFMVIVDKAYMGHLGFNRYRPDDHSWEIDNV